MLEAFDLSGKVALVTGAGKGLGRAIAHALAGAGADVALLARTAADLERVAEEVRARGRRALVCPADVTRRAEVEAAVERVVAEWASLDILVNNAGIGGTTPVLELDEDIWNRFLAVNLTGPVFCAQAAGREMVKRRRGKIINVASVLAHTAARYMAAYAATKAALVQFTRILALEWSRHNIQVNALCPGYFLTPMNEEFFATDAGRRLIESMPMKRIGAPEEIGGAVVFLASDAASYVTGATLYVDGGQSLR